VGKEMGNVSHTAYATALETVRLLLTGQQLDECHAHCERAAAYLIGIHALGPLEAVDMVRRALGQLRASDGAPPDTSDEDFKAKMVKGGNAQYLFSHGQIQAMVSFLLGDAEAAARWDAFTTPYLPAGTSLFAQADHTLFQTLTLVRRWPALAAVEQDAARATLDANLEKLAKWAANCPENFAHKHKLATAEVARLRRAPLDEILALYDQAVAATGADFPHMRALANELQGEMWIERDQRKVARAFVQEAHYLYQRWGARAKLRQLEQRFPEWLLATSAPANARATYVTHHANTVDTVQGASLDINSVIKATQAVSSEVTQERLYGRLMATIIENAGAQRGCLIIESDSGELEVAARAGVDDGPRAVGAAGRIEDGDELCPDIVRYVARTRDTVVLDDARHHERYQKDDYIRRNGIKSVLCVPVVQQGKLLGVLYAENNAATHAFTPGRLNLLQVIASQAAISITNARLYSSLEEKVAERTRELAEKNREVAVMLHSLHQGVFTIDQNLAIQPQYSRHLEEILDRRELAGVDCFEVLFAGADLSPDDISAARAALECNFGMEAFIAEANADHLVRELRRHAHAAEPQHLEVDWRWIVDDHDCVEKVLVTLRDVTVLKQLTRTVREKSREVDIVGQILEVGLEAFQGFCRSSRALISEMRTVLGSDLGWPSAHGANQIKHVLRNLHTVKGNARTLGLGHIVDVAHHAEDECIRFSEAANYPDLQSLVERADELLATVAEHEEVYERKLGNLTARRSAGIERALAEVQAAVRAAGGGTRSAADALGEVERAVARATATSIDELVREASRSLPSLARDLDKIPPVVDCQDAGLMLAEPFTQVMRDVLAHAFRNALDHGIEGATERREQRKPPQGHISVRSGRSDGHVIIGFADDGRGLPLTALRAKTDAIHASDEELAERAFQSGVTTAAALTSISGRGVGLDAIRSFLRSHGGDARIAFTGPARGGYRPFELILELPSSAIAS
jgi:GAF domain-containing protein/HPt (histidine-containing phosphotransfer) domain-containing protein